MVDHSKNSAGFNTPLSHLSRSSKEISKEILELNYTLDQLIITSTDRKEMIFSGSYGAFSKINHIAGTKQTLTGKTEKFPSILRDCSL